MLYALTYIAALVHERLWQPKQPVANTSQPQCDFLSDDTCLAGVDDANVFTPIYWDGLFDFKVVRVQSLDIFRFFTSPSI